MNSQMPPAEFSPIFFRGHLWILLVATLLGILWSIIIPPLKSLDEPDHLRRAYILAAGQWMVSSQPCAENGPNCRDGKTMSGGLVDSGLANYLSIRDMQNGALFTVTRAVERQAASIRWSGEDVFVIAPGAAYYFPLTYAPQALGLKIGKFLNLSVHNSYYLARLMSLICTVTVLWYAFSIFKPSTTTLALLLIPMSLFQAVSASLDPFSTALAILGLACFQRSMTLKETAPITLLAVMAMAIFLVATARAHLSSMVLMLFVSSWSSGRRLGWILSFITTAGIIIWMAISIPNAVDLRADRILSTNEVVSQYISQPMELLDIFYRTITDQGVQIGVWASFLAGFLGIQVSQWIYVVLTVSLVLIVFVSLADMKQIRVEVVARVTLLVVGLCACFLALLAMALTWTDFPARVISGIQGRYFLVPMIFILCSMTNWSVENRKNTMISEVLLIFLFAFGFSAITNHIIESYYVPWRAQALPEMTELRVSNQLSRDKQVVIRFDEVSRQLGSRISRIGIRMATYTTTFQGKGHIIIYSGNGNSESREILLEEMKDNQYFYIDVSPNSWMSAELSLRSGDGGPSAWEAHKSDPDGRVTWQTCVILQTLSGERVITPGCNTESSL